MYNYIINFKNSQFYNKILILLLILITFSLFFPIRHVFLTKEAYLTGTYSDFTSFSLYLSDILLFLLAVALVLPRGGEYLLRIKGEKSKLYKFLPPTSYLLLPIKWLILAIFVIFVVHFGLNTRLSAYFLIKWLEFLVSYGTFRLIFEQNGLKMLFLKLFVWFCAFESLIALAQFAKQSSLGLYRLGESHIAPNILGVAKIVSGGTIYIRGYGTFPHPNPLSAFLVAGILISTYLLTTSLSQKTRITYSILLFINILGLTVTFSRGAYLALAAGLVIFFGFMFFRRHPEGVHPTDLSAEVLAKVEGSPTSMRFFSSFRMTPMIVVLISIIVSFSLFKPFLLTRATFADQSTIARKFYDVTGIKMAKKNPLFGIGLGESMLHMEQYSDKMLAPWDKQPPHNYFILAAAEMGIPAMLILLWIFLAHLKSLILPVRQSLLSDEALAKSDGEGGNLKSHLTTYYLLLTTILCTFLVLMQFDHYFYTLQQTQLVLWIFLALISSEIKNPRTGENLKS